MDPVVNLTPSCGLRGKLIRATDSTAKAERDVYAFLGIPYAEPPTGSMRFTNPRPVSLWNGIRDAKQFGAACPQDLALLDILPFPLERPELMSEDCLSLNIWTTSLDPASRLPVMFWIHGGGLNMGYSSQYNGSTLVSCKDVIVVVINYRLGPFGFLCTNDSASTGNYGILDQIEALKWVQKHIAHFGGDPDNVTVFGESAGGMCASLLAVSPPARGLFRRAIAESGSVFGGDLIACPPEKALKNLLASLAKGFPDRQWDTATGAEIVEFLRQQPADVLTTLGDNFFAVVDGHVLPTSPVNIYDSAAHNHVDLMIGCTSDEGCLILKGLSVKYGLKPDQFDINIARMFISNYLSGYFTFPDTQDIVEAVVSLYLADVDSNASPEDVQKVLVEFLGDSLFLIPAIQTANFHSRNCRTFLYIFCHRPAFAWFPPWADADHGTELCFLGIFDVSTFNPSAEDRELSRQIMSYWANFAKTGDPNDGELVHWPQYNESSKEYMRLRIPAKADASPKEQRTDFWLRQLPDMIKKKTAANM